MFFFVFLDNLIKILSVARCTCISQMSQHLFHPIFVSRHLTENWGNFLSVQWPPPFPSTRYAPVKGPHYTLTNHIFFSLAWIHFINQKLFCTSWSTILPTLFSSKKKIIQEKNVVWRLQQTNIFLFFFSLFFSSRHTQQVPNNHRLLAAPAGGKKRKMTAKISGTHFLWREREMRGYCVCQTKKKKKIDLSIIGGSRLEALFFAAHALYAARKLSSLALGSFFGG